MLTLNEHTILGRLGQDPEVRFTQSNVCVTTLSVATDEPFKNANGEWERKPEWHRVIIWGEAAKKVGDTCRKGDSILVKGPSKTREWEDKDGNKRYITETTGVFVSILNSSVSAETPPEPSNTASRPERKSDPKPAPKAEEKKQPESTMFDDSEDDSLPF